jgi:hypothetical protein
MALIDTLGCYIKLNKDNSFEIYSNEEARLKVKGSTPAETINAKYVEILNDLQSDEYAEMRHYDNINYAKLYTDWLNEWQRYTYNLTSGSFTEAEDYPLMAAYYPDVADSIPKILSRGKIVNTALDYSFETVEEAYLNAKQKKTWGETTDA